MKKKQETKQKSKVQLIDFDQIKSMMLTKLKEVKERDSDNWGKKESEKRLAKKIINTLKKGVSFDKEGAKGSNVIKPSLGYYSKTVSRLRRAIRDSGLTHYAFEKSIHALVDKFNLFPKELNEWSAMSGNEATTYKAELLKAIEKKINATKKKDKKEALINLKDKVKKIDVYPEIMKHLIKTEEEKEELEEAKEARLSHYAKNRKFIDYDATYLLIADCLASHYDWAKLAYGLALASGRRFIELVDPNVGQFSLASRNNEVIFTTTAKTKKLKEYRIPLLVDAQTFLDCLNRFRAIERVARVTNSEEYKAQTHFERNVIVNNSMQRTLNKRIAELTNGEDSIHDARAKYARIAYEEYAARERKAGRLPKDDTDFFTSNLGHEERSTQLSYRRYLLKEDLKERATKAAKVEAIETKEQLESKDRLVELEKLFATEEMQTAAFKKYADFVLEKVKADESTKISTTLIKTELGGNKGIICKFVAELKKADLDKAK